MTRASFHWAACAAACAALLAGCGGSPSGSTTAGSTVTSTPATPTPPAGAGSSPSTSAASFALAAGYQARVASGANDAFNVSGSCDGTATIVAAAAIPASFEGVAGFSAAQVSTILFSNCTPPSSLSMGTTYFNADGVPIGLNIVGGEYAKPASAAADFPVMVKVGDSAVLSTQTSYTDSTQSVVSGRRTIGFVIEADTGTTAIANLITRSYNTSEQLLATQQSRFRVAENGSLTLLSIDVQFSTTSTVHLVYTPK